MVTKVGGLILNNRLSAVPIFLASLVFPCLGQFPRAGDDFPRLDELKRKNRDCSQSSGYICLKLRRQAN